LTDVFLGTIGDERGWIITLNNSSPKPPNDRVDFPTKVLDRRIVDMYVVTLFTKITKYLVYGRIYGVFLLWLKLEEYDFN